MPPLALMLALCLTPALAQETPAVPVAESPVELPARGEQVSLEAEVLSEYLEGQKIIIAFKARNLATSGQRVFPDLSNRPWLVRFELTFPGGKTEVRYTTPPEQDPGGDWPIPARGLRRVLLEIPSSSALPLGDYSLAIKITDGDLERELSASSFKVVRARPGHAHGPWDGPLSERVGQQTAWVHDGKTAHELYLLQANPQKPGEVSANLHLATLETDSDPWLSLSLPAQGWSRHVHWQESERMVGLVHIRGPGQPPLKSQVASPWPKLELLGAGVSTAGGVLHAPVWVPAPSGKGGHVRVLTWEHRQIPFFRRVVQLDHPVDDVTTGVDGAGNLRLVLHHDSHLDLYTVDVTADHQLPASGLRLSEAEGQGRILDAAFGILPAEEGWKGGRALMLLEEVAGEEEGEHLARARWLSMSGESLHTSPTVPWDEAWTVDSVLPRGGDDFAVLLRKGEGWAVVRAGGQPRTVKTKVRPELVLDTTGEVWVRHMVDGRKLISARTVE